MEIVVTNDDGWGTKGIRTLVEEMSRLGHITVVAPDSPRSGHGACISVGRPIYLRKEESDCNGHVDVYTSTGTPADCVKVAIEVLLKDKKIDLVASGINHGSNCSVNLVYSGTMGACFVAAEHGLPAIGFSLDDHAQDADFSQMQPHIVPITENLLAKGFVPGRCYNVNAPVGDIIGICTARQCKGHWEKEMETYQDENGETYYTLAGNYVNEEPDDEHTDIWAINHGKISIQPVNIDMTDHGAL